MNKRLKTEAQGYYIWLMPSGSAYDRLRALILKLSKEYSTPLFEPHITVIGGMIGQEDAIVAKTAELASFVKPCIIKLNKIDHRKEYFKCLFLHAEETQPLLDINLKAREIFSRQADPARMLHLSLLYGDLSVSVKDEIIRRIDKDASVEFKASKIFLISCSGPPKDWHIIKEFSLGKEK